MVMLWNLVVLVGFVVERGGGQKAGHPTYKKGSLAEPESRTSNTIMVIIPVEKVYS